MVKVIDRAIKEVRLESELLSLAYSCSMQILILSLRGDLFLK